jgi:excisionase family DNA binding protein
VRVTDLAAQLRQLADRVDALDLEPAQVAGELEALRFRVWTAAMPRPVPVAIASPAPPTEAGKLTQEDAARAYAIPLRTIRRLTRTGRVASTLVGRNRMIRPADLDRYLARCREQGVKVGTLLDTRGIHNE